MQAWLGLVLFCVLGWLCSTARHAIHWRQIILGVALQFALAALMLYVPWVRPVFDVLNSAVNALQTATNAGTRFVFGYLAGGPTPYAVTSPQHQFIFVFGALPLVLVISALTAVLTYWRILPWVIGITAHGLEKLFALRGAVGFAAAANVFLGMVEAPLFVKPYLARMTKAELFVLMVTGMSTIAGTVLVLYATILATVIPDPLAHLLIASVISVPAGVVFAQLMVPETVQHDAQPWSPPREADSTMEAIANGTQIGLTMCLQIAAMLVVLVSLVHLVNLLIQALVPPIANAPVTLERMLGIVMSPVAWVMGIPWSEATRAGQLLGVKSVLNELIAYLQMAALPAEALSAKSRLILTYALCGFANIGSLGIMIAGLNELVPTRRLEIIELGWRSLFAGTLATLSTGAIIGLVAH